MAVPVAQAMGDARAWSRATGQDVVSLALSGSWGYAGSLNLLRRTLRLGLHPKLVLLVQTVEMMRRPISYDGLLYSAESLAAYRAAVDAQIRAAGLTVLAGTLFCMPLDEAGDAPDHVYSAFEAQYSEAYLDRVSQQGLRLSGWHAQRMNDQRSARRAAQRTDGKGL